VIILESNYIVIHGSFGSPFINWFSWLYQKLSDENNEVTIPQFPIGIGIQTYDNWSKLLEYYLDLGSINEKTIFIGHSIAPIFIIKFLLEKQIKVKKIICVSGFNNYSVDGGDYDKVNSSFFVNNDISNIKKYCEDIICIYSDNDPYVSKNALDDFANNIATKTKVISNGGHLNGEAGYITFDELLEYL
jgi:predicted alpha/beta hydrolase family esterase